MADVEWKPLPEGLWTPPAVFADVGNLCLQAFTDDGVPTWEICKKKGEGAEGDRHDGSPEVGSQDPFLRWLACRDRNGCGYHRERARGRSKAEDLQGGKICSAAAARRPACRPGKFFRRAG